jgi:hypothetical protein
MTDETRPLSPGEMPRGPAADPRLDEIPTQTEWSAPLGNEPGIADDLGPTGDDTADEVVRDPADRAREEGLDVLGDAEPPNPSDEDPDARGGPPSRHGGH